MKLNPDCVRFVLIMVEKETGHNKTFMIPAAGVQDPEFTADEIFYHINQCKDAGLLGKVTKNVLGEYEIFDLSPKGHEFLSNIRENTVWNKTKQISKSAGIATMSTLVQIASAVISDVISKNL